MTDITISGIVLIDNEIFINGLADARERSRRIRKFKSRSENEAVLLTIEQARSRYNLSRYSLMQLAEEANAVIRIGRVVRISKPIIDSTLGMIDI